MGNFRIISIILPQMKSFIGTYECKMDDKGRLKLPVPLLKQMKGFDSETFVVKRSVFQNCLEVYSMTNWDKLMSKINGLNRFVKKNADFIRAFTAGVKTVELDASERIQLSKDLIAYANLSKELVVASAGELFEIWDKEKYENVINNSETDFSALAEEVMGI